MDRGDPTAKANHITIEGDALNRIYLHAYKVTWQDVAGTLWALELSET